MLLEEYFIGEFTNKIECQECKIVTLRTEKFMDIPLNFGIKFLI